MFKNQLAAFTIATALTQFTALAQEDYARFKSEATVQSLGSFVTQTTQDGVQHGASDSTGVFATCRYYFSRHNGFEVNYAWSSNTHTYNGSVFRRGARDQFDIDSNSDEISAAYVFRLPIRRWSPFALAGAGALVFDPKNYTGANMQTRTAFIYGAGADINLTDHLFVRGEYRGFVYNSPTFDLASLNGLDRVTHRAEPSIGFGWRF